MYVSTQNCNSEDPNSGRNEKGKHSVSSLSYKGYQVKDKDVGVVVSEHRTYKVSQRTDYRVGRKGKGPLL